ncbi:MAG: hypothetical protein OXI45_13660 [Acidobacteriota bacterium]|nr:hypothetical protein [Acidobacteriota bacterium]
MDRERLTAEVEIRDADSGPVVGVTLIQEGRAATGGRSEVFAPKALVWPSEGVPLRTEHLGGESVRIHPHRDAELRISASAPASASIVEAVRSGKRHASIEFYAMDEVRTAAGIREIREAWLVGAALVSKPEYEQSAAELRAKRRVYV